MKIKVITLNTWFCAYFDSLAEFIQLQNPDVLLLQEVPHQGIGIHPQVTLNAYDRLCSLLQIPSHFAPMWHFSRDNSIFYSGLAIFSSLPIQEDYRYFYYSHQRSINFFQIQKHPLNFPGLFLAAKLQLHHFSFWVATTHFPWSLHPQITDYQLQAVSNLIAQLPEFPQLILGGDFNFTPDSNLYGQLQSVLVDDTPKTPGYSLTPSIHPAASKNLLVDYLFHQGHQIKLLDSLVPPVTISDHLPVIATYELQSSI